MASTQHFSEYNALNYDCTGISRDRLGRLVPMAGLKGRNHRHRLSGAAPALQLIANTVASTDQAPAEISGPEFCFIFIFVG